LGSHLSEIDDKSGYDHIIVYQTVGWFGSTTFFREMGISCSLYIDDRLIRDIFSQEGYRSRDIELRDSNLSRESASAALYVVCRVLVRLGYFLGLKKCILSPTAKLQFLGMLIDTHAQVFLIPQEKRIKFAELREATLACKSSMPLKSLQRLLGKCSSFLLAFPGAKFYIREMAAAIGKAGRAWKWL
jgi:hypothetical protein